MSATSNKSSPQVACVVVNWNGWADTIQCLDALKAVDYSNLYLIVVDNGSTDDSVRMIKKTHPDILVLEAGANLGFAGGNNIGMRHALGRGIEYVWLLNNDTQAEPEALSALVGKARTDDRIGAVGSICYYADSPAKVQAWAGAKINMWIGYGRITTVPEPDEWFDSVYGASMLISAPALREVGLLDEGFFHYWEESELCLRLMKKGWTLAAAPESRILHKVGGSMSGGSVVLDRYFTASGLRILSLHSPAPRLAMVLFLAARFVRRIVRLQFDRCRSVWDGVKDFRRQLPIRQRVR